MRVENSYYKYKEAKLHKKFHGNILFIFFH